jgi:hypothetical protein
VTRRLAAALAQVALLAASARSEVAGAQAPDSFDYLYIRAHEGNASGGHAAIRFGSEIYDFQHAAGGWLAIRREDSRRFQHEYRALQNRSIEVSRVEATQETVALLRETFERRLLAQSRQQLRLSELEADVAIQDALAAGKKARVRVRGAGFFADAPGGAAPPALSELRERIAEAHGEGWLAARADAALRTLREREASSPDSAPPQVDPLTYPVAREPLTRRASRALAARAASDLILRPRPLREGVRAGEGQTPDAWLTLDPALRARLVEARAGLLESAVALAASPRPDWGEALLLACARLAAMDESLAAGRLVMLDAFPADAKLLRVGPRRRTLLPTLLGDARRDFVDAHRDLFSEAGYDEASWSELERAVTRIAGLRAAQEGAVSLRVAVGAMLPDGSAERPLAPGDLGADPADGARAAEASRAALRDYRSALEAQYRYDVVRRNCVSELFRTIELALASAGDAPPQDDRDTVHAFVQRESVRRLGGYVDPVADANFIPFVSSRNVQASWHVAEVLHLPSAREHAVEGEGGGLAAALRESNVLTSTVYEPAEDAGFFLFFTDGEWPLRPLLGAANLAAALARSGVGVLELPFDRGQGIRAGLSGVLWSLPELFFTNIRKGTNEYVPPAQRPPVQ